VSGGFALVHNVLDADSRYHEHGRLKGMVFRFRSAFPTYPALMTNVDVRRLERRFDRLERKLPGAAARTLRRLRMRDARWVRLPAGVLLVAGGLLSFLPVLGIWMLPLGLLLLALDVPALRRPTSRAMIWGERKWIAWRRRRRGPT
jgi:hypothetical protein